MSHDATIIHPTAVIALDLSDPKNITLRLATVPTQIGDALLVFRSEADAEKYRAETGNHPAAEDWTSAALDRADFANLLRMHGLNAVVLCEDWTGTGGTDLFTAANFLELLDSAEPVA